MAPIASKGCGMSPSAPPLPTETQQGTRESTTSSTRQKSGPTVPPSSSIRSAQDGRFGTGLGFGEQPHKRACFLRPPATHFSSKNDKARPGTGANKARPGTGANKFRISAFFPASSGVQRNTVDGGLHLGEQHHHNGAGSPMWRRWEALGNHFQPSAVECLWCQHVQIANHDVRGHTGATFTANSGHCILHSKPPPRQQPRLRTRCTMMAKGVKLAATSAGASSGRERKTKPAEQKDPEQTRGNAQGKTRRCG